MSFFFFFFFFWLVAGFYLAAAAADGQWAVGSGQWARRQKQTGTASRCLLVLPQALAFDLPEKSSTKQQTNFTHLKNEHNSSYGMSVQSARITEQISLPSERTKLQHVRYTYIGTVVLCKAQACPAYQGTPSDICVTEIKPRISQRHIHD
jgi:hypothetical protein